MSMHVIFNLVLVLLVCLCSRILEPELCVCIFLFEVINHQVQYCMGTRGLQVSLCEAAASSCSWASKCMTKLKILQVYCFLCHVLVK
jgi:hypothetical protein